MGEKEEKLDARHQDETLWAEGVTKMLLKRPKIGKRARTEVEKEVGKEAIKEVERRSERKLGRRSERSPKRSPKEKEK